MMHPVKQLFQTVIKPAFTSVDYAFAYGSAAFIQLGRSRVC